MDFAPYLNKPLAFVKTYETSALDDSIDVFDLLISDISTQAKLVGKKHRLRTIKDLDRSALYLADFCSLILNSQENVTKFLNNYRERIHKSIETVNELARQPDDNYHNETAAQFGRVRRLLPVLFSKMKFECNRDGKAILNALEFLASAGYHKTYLVNPPGEVITGAWISAIKDKEGILRKEYTLCTLMKLQDSLRRRDIYVSGSDRWADPRKKLLSNEDWLSRRGQFCRSLGHSIDEQEAIKRLSFELDSTYKKVINNFPANEHVKVNDQDKNSLTLSNLDRLEEPDSLEDLSKKVRELIPEIDITELLLEIDTHTGFTKEFSHVSEENSRVDDLNISICAVLISEACNIGMEPLANPNIPALTLHRLNWVKQNYIRSETITRANARLVEHQSKLPLANLWGGGEVASADGMRFITPVKTLNSGLNRKYFASHRGITWYNFMSDQFSGIHAIPVPGTIRDSIYVLTGLLEHQTSLRPKEIMTDTAGSSDMVFGLFYLLGYQFSPRLADAGSAVFCRINKDADYGILNKIARSRINTKKIERHWDDMLRVAASLKMGSISAPTLIKTLLRTEKPSSLAQAIINLGKINKTIYLLNYIDDEDYRRRILRQLNRTEGRHKVARNICHGQRGEIRKRYKEGQEDQLGALGLVTNAAVLWNTMYIQKILDHLRDIGEVINEEDVARLSPLLHKHINVLGHYYFILSDHVSEGKLRDLNINDEIFIFHKYSKSQL